MKKKVICTTILGLLSLGFGGFSNNADAANYKPPGKAEEGEYFDNMDDSESIVVLPDGAIISGGVFEIDDPNLFDKPVVIDTETSPAATTVEEYKESVGTTPKFNRGDLLRRATPAPNSAAGKYTIPNQGKYQSNAFSGSGWRFAGYNFKPADGTGAYLQWQTYRDSGVVGTMSDASSTYSTGYAYGTLLYTGYYIYRTGSGNFTTYYSYNPIPGSYYEVRNW
ncbi:hypothetical protein [Enterococcus sp. CWB-B31]|uniref:hypothetical protein n=1 Tax=Enterococcus sp. CWB-B31 TaxID=2885159 RepID=UPI001E331509|nr:hypothetical protein [Enterococcus sp. CWB-B31]MCB5955548.1 hypothetical protein [Enterococcus sp. CWB-B31]